jgi:hypothetical protein
MDEITPACLAPRQGEYVIMATCLTVMTGKSAVISLVPGPVSGGLAGAPARSVARLPACASRFSRAA